MENNTHPKNHIGTKVLTYIVFIALAVLLFLFGRSVKDNIVSAPVEKPSNTGQLVDMSLVTEIPLTSESKYATISGSYPVFKNASGTLNDKIRNNIVIVQAEFENNAKENWQARLATKLPGEKIKEFPEDGDMFFNLKTEYIQVNPKMISVLITVQAMSGGAHGYQNLYSYNYDVSQNRELTLQDFFPNDSDYLKKVSDYSRNDLTAQFTGKIKNENMDLDGDFKMTIENINSMLIPGTEPTVENFSVFTTTPGFLNIYFGEYQVAAYVYGIQTVKMPLK